MKNNTAFYIGEYTGQIGVVVGSSYFMEGLTGGMQIVGNAAAVIEGVQILVPVVTTVSAINQGTTGNIVKEASGSKGASDTESSDSKDNSNAQEAERLATENGYDDAHDLKKSYVGKNEMSKFRQGCINRRYWIVYLDDTKIMVDFWIGGDYPNIQSITLLLGVNPTEIRYKESYKIKEFAKDSWSISTGYEKELAVSVPFEKTVDIFKDKVEKINKIKEKYSLESVIIIVVKANINYMPEYVLTSKCIDFASRTNSEIHFDNYIYENEN